MKDKPSTTVFIASVLIGILIALNFNLESVSKMFTVNDYDELYNERLRLHSQLNGIRVEYEELKEKVDRYTRVEDDNQKISEELENELVETRFEAGLTEVQGEGIRIIINDLERLNSGGEFTSLQLIHNYDISLLINDLVNAGAEAIAINGERVIFNTYSYCEGVTIDLGGIKLASPFYIEAIGNKSVMKNYLILNDTQYKKILSRGININIDEIYSLTLPAYKSKIDNEYIRKK